MPETAMTAPPNKYRLKRYGVRVVYAKEAIPEGPEGILLESVLEGSAEYYSANLSQNIKRGMHYNALECKINGGTIPFGYCRGEDGRYKIQESEAEIVREIFTKVGEGVPFVEISNDLNGRGKAQQADRVDGYEPLQRDDCHGVTFLQGFQIMEGGRNILKFILKRTGNSPNVF